MGLMIDRTFDPSSMLSATREAFAPLLEAQREGLKSLERLARLQYAVAGDVLESGLARVNATFAATPSELLSRQTELSTEFADKLRARAEEFASLTREIQARFARLGNEIAAKAVPAGNAA
jgi:hypothetical protein